jgi:hypothetical protein
MSQLAYTSQKPFEDKSSNVLVVACSGYAFLPFVREFLDAHLKLPEGSYNLIAVPGGPQFLAVSEYLPKFAWVGQKWMTFAIEKLQVRRIILVWHQECVWYGDERFVPALLHALGHGERTMKDRQLEDLRHVVATMRASVPVASVEAYYIDKGGDGHLTVSREA